LSDFDEKMMQKLKRLEREVERLQRWEKPIVVTDHGTLTGLGDNDHPQYLLTTGKAADSDKLDGVDSSGFVNMSSAQTVGGTKTFSSIPVLPSTNPTLANQAIRKGYADATYRLASTAIDHGSLTGLGDNDHPQYLLTTGKAADSDKLDGYDSADFGRPVFLTTPLTSTSWDGDARSTTSATKIDTSAVFGVPDGVKALIVRVLARDSATFPNTSTYFQIGSSSSANNQIRLYPVGGDIMATVTGICNCDANGDIYYSLASSGTDTMDCWIYIWGYWL
jgi:hypothetical protein